jgi:uncharacterized repeat protein (TIGR03943 family)
VNADTESLLLVLLGGALVRISIDDTFLRYVREWMRPALLVAGALLVVLGVLSLWREHRPSAAAEPAAGGDTSDGHAHGPWTAWLLVLPVVAIFVVAPPALGSYMAERSTATVTEPAESEFPPLAAGDPAELTLTDYATRAIWDRGRTLTGRRVRLVGFVSPRPTGGFCVTRIAVTCCAADARPIRIAVPAPPRTFPPDTWVAVTGMYGGVEPAPRTANEVPVLRVDSVEPVPAPADPYET